MFTNGGYDPWSSAGVNETVSDSVISVYIPEGAHHLDLMFSTPEDPPSVKRARKIQMDNIKKWIAQYATKPEHRVASKEL